MPVQMFMVHFMCPPDGPYIIVVTTGKPFKPLMNDYIMYHEVSKAIGHDTKTNRLYPPNVIKSTGVDQQNARHCKNDKERIILFKKARLCLVMIFVQVP